MKGYGQYCPLAKASEVIAERWTPLVLRELFFGSHTFNDIHRGIPLISRSLLSKRLKELLRAGVIERRPTAGGHQYHLTEAGLEMEPILMGMASWGVRWITTDVNEHEMDPRPLMWDVRRRLNLEQLPDRRIVIEFVFPDVPRAALKRVWLVLDRPDVDVCYRDPGHDVDLVVTAPFGAMVKVWLGDMDMRQAAERGQIRVEGPFDLRSALPSWLALSVVAEVPRPGAAAASEDRPAAVGSPA